MTHRPPAEHPSDRWASRGPSLLFTPDMTEAFRDWLRCDSIRQTLLEARPEMATDLAIHPHRPMLWIRRPAGNLLIARMHETERYPWLVGIVAGSSPVLHDVADSEAVTALIFKLLDEK